MTREEAKREILFAKREVMADSWIDKAFDMAIKALTQPEIIRCEDCYHYPNEFADCPLIGWARNENDFCSKAERREE